MVYQYFFVVVNSALLGHALFLQLLAVLDGISNLFVRIGICSMLKTVADLGGFPWF